MHLGYKNKGLLFFTLGQILTTEIFYCPEGDDVMMTQAHFLN